MRNKQDNKLAVGYIRSAVKDDLSIEKQGSLIREYASNNGYELTTVFSDNGYSGANLNRPDFQRLLNQVRTGKIKRVITVNADRLSRNLGEFLALKALMDRHDVEVRTVFGITKDASAQLMESLVATIYAWEDQLLKRKHRKGK